MTDDTETAPVVIEVAPLTPVTGKSAIKFVTAVSLTISGIEIVLEGVTVRESRDHTLGCWMPAYRHPRTGELYSAIGLPPELSRAIAKSVLEHSGIGRVMTMPMRDDA